MAHRPANHLEMHFEEPGSLPQPAIVGRIVRLLLGLWLLFLAVDLLRSGPVGLIDTSAPTHWSWWLAVAIGLAVFPYVVNIGFTLDWKHWPRVAVLGISGLLVALDLLVYGTWWAPPLGAVTFLWMLYWTAHLGLSFALAAIIATPGCEMRAIPHLWTLTSDRPTKEHYCPGFLDRLDAWERQRRT